MFDFCEVLLLCCENFCLSVRYAFESSIYDNIINIIYKRCSWWVDICFWILVRISSHIFICICLFCVLFALHLFMQVCAICWYFHGFQNSVRMAYQMYRSTTLGNALQQTLDEMIQVCITSFRVFFMFSFCHKFGGMYSTPF